MSDEATDNASADTADAKPACDCALTGAYILLRLWLGLRLLGSGLEKFKVQGETKYSLDAYKSFVGNTGGLITENTLMPGFAVNAFMWPLGFVMIATGLMILVGFLNRLALFVGGLIFVSLSVGMILLPDDDQVLGLGLYVGLFAAALALVKHNRLAITKS